jgi:hypothetical protein
MAVAVGGRATLNIYAALRLAFDNPEYVYGFPSMENRVAGIMVQIAPLT